MQMSAELRRNSVCGPGCAAMAAANGADLVMPRAPGLLGPRQRSSGARPLCVHVDAERADDGSCGSRVTVCICRKIFFMCAAQRGRQLGVSAVVGQHEDDRWTPPSIAA